MKKEYELQTDVLETVVAGTPVTARHAALLTAFATRSDFRRARYVAMRDHWSARPARILDPEGREVADDYRAWVHQALDEHGGDASSVWHAYKHRRYLLTEVQSVQHFFAHDRGGEQDDFVQILVGEEQEFIERELFENESWSSAPSVDELREARSYGAHVERRLIGEPRYRLDRAIDLRAFNELADRTFADTHRRDGDRQLRVTNPDSGESKIVSVREFTPGYDTLQRDGRRFFDDWTESSAGRSGERICTRWIFNPSDYGDRTSVRTLSVVPQWAHTRKIAAVRGTAKLDVYGLYGRLNQFDKRIGMPFAWYFYGLHGNLVLPAHIERVIEGAEAGLIVLPEHDYQVLRRWSAAPYGF
ncbi:hypothetical protein [Burkholderia cenocepacia]|jgi:hypothetical protein|uniref:hypothetical protein n=1 Tax=Burkholderia cenocepacia TaxID=95486 RepID=UPI0026556C87|nr:hypothetical protein [Burkholderia cenocepacia]MDN7631639.1 hypothetical protein [Burkholderia cenocepacia]